MFQHAFCLGTEGMIRVQRFGQANDQDFRLHFSDQASDSSVILGLALAANDAVGSRQESLAEGHPDAFLAPIEGQNTARLQRLASAVSPKMSGTTSTTSTSMR